jgi:nitroimidazol reductase NimA-like FMN-containing flavoprotein (pyridoxamine 5'-phosphate oxidase superfamily)
VALWGHEGETVSEIRITQRTKLSRLPQRGNYDRDVINRILDEGFICHVGFVMDGQPFVIPTGYGRRDDQVYFHGSSASRMLRNLSQGAAVCLTVTLLDGLVLARSAFHHSMNYRSVVVLGNAKIVPDSEKAEALRIISDNIIRGRWNEVREPNEAELKATTVLMLPIDEASAKIRTGPPIDEPSDCDLPIWAGVLPLRSAAGEPIVDPAMRMQVELPDSVRGYSRK